MTESVNFAIVRSGGKQFKVATGDQITVEKLPEEVGAAVTLSEVLLIANGEDVKIGKPLLANASVQAKVVKQDRGPKVVVYKFKRRKGYDKKTGHRQSQTTLKIMGISA